MSLLDTIAQSLATDPARWPDRRGDYHADCPYCGKPAKKGQVHFRISPDGLCYCQVCQAGTSLSALADHLGIKAERNGSIPQTVYPYYSADGVLLYEVVRYYKGKEKSFYQRHPNADGEMVNGMNGVERVLYRLPELLSRPPGTPVYIVEGEKDVEMLRMRGLVATTNVGGAGKWQAAYSAALKDADVIILPDNDKVGEQHAQTVCQSLQGVVRSAKIVRLPNLLEHGDISDWIVAGHTLVELATLCIDPPKPVEKPLWEPHIISAAELRRKAFPTLVWTVDGLLPEGVCVLAGKPKSKKSWLALGISIGVASNGRAFSYYDVTGGRVLYLDLESNQRRMQSRLRSIIGDHDVWPDILDIVTEWKRGDEGIALLDGYCDAHTDTRLIVIDIWARFRARIDPKLNPYDQDYEALQTLNAWAEARHVTVIVIHHTRKAKSDDVFEEISGTNGILGAVATVMHLARSTDQQDEYILSMTGRDVLTDEPIALKWDNYTCQHIYVATGAEASSSAERRKILDVMERGKNYQLKELAALLRKTTTNLSNQLRRLMDDNLIVRTGRGYYTKNIYMNEYSEIHEESEENEESEEFSTKQFTQAHRSEDRSEDRLKHHKATNGVLHSLHSDSHTHNEMPFTNEELARIWGDA